VRGHPRPAGSVALAAFLGAVLVAGWAALSRDPGPAEPAAGAAENPARGARRAPAASVRSERRPLPSSLTGPSGAATLAATDARGRIDAINSLDAVGRAEGVDALAMAAVGDVDPAVRIEAVSALGDRAARAGDPIAERGAYALALALRDPEVEVRREAVEAFTRMGGEHAVAALAPALSDVDARVRREAVDALGDLGGEAAAGLLRHVAGTDADAGIREAARDYLAEVPAQ